MKYKAYMKICMLLILLFITKTGVSVQESHSFMTKEFSDSTYQNVTEHQLDTLTIIQTDKQESGLQTRSCVNSFTNQTVSSNVYVVGCNTLTVQDVTVTGSGDLTLTAPGEITINGVFDVLSGGVLNVHLAPPVNNMQNPIDMGTFGAPFQYTDTKNSNDYTNEYNGRPTNDIFYKFTLTTALTVTIKHCGSFGDTYLSLLNSEGTLIAYNDNYSGPGSCSNTSQAYLSLLLPVGIYYIVSEGYSSNGNIQTTVTGEIPQIFFNYLYDSSGNRISRNL